MKPDESQDLGALYDARFSETERRAKENVWRILCEQFFQQFVAEDAAVLDLACGFGEFSRFVRAGRKVALDSNPRVRSTLPEEVEFVHGSALDLSVLERETIDVCFTSNFFEHLPDRASMDRVLQEVRGVLRPGGAFVAMQPNIKYAGGAYWDFYDHVLPLSHLSAREAFLKNDYLVERVIPRFVPFSTKSAYPKHPALVWTYLKLPLLWRLLGKQFVIVARKPEATPTRGTA